ncbi:MAG: RNA polymerase sigma factor [bacterium]|nr:RNA polymerase sigma factor [bacterium]
MKIQNSDFKEIYKEFYPKILRYLTRVIENKDEAEDFTQEVFIKVSTNLDKFEGRSSLSTWIYKIASNLANDRFRSTSFQKGTKNTLTEEFLDDNKEDKNVWTDEKEDISDKVLEKKEMNSCIKRYVEDISDNYKTAFILSEYEGLKNNEIAQILGLSLDSVKIRIHRARTQLKKKMEIGCEISKEDTGFYCDEK